MGPDLELTGRSEIYMEDSPCNAKGSIPQDLHDERLRCNHDGNIFGVETLPVERTTTIDESEDVELNITDCVNTSNIELVENNCEDATENSSSFGDSFSGIENSSALSDGEVQSSLLGHNISASVFDECGEVFVVRKKKLTAHWRKFIHPLMWRCKWLELKIKEFHSQALRYDLELAEYNQRKQSELKTFALEGFGAKSLPFSAHNLRKNISRRKKRKRIEEITDLASYMSRHNLFSYYGMKKSAVDGVSMVDVFGNQDKAVNSNVEFGYSDEGPLLEFGDGDSSLEHILRRISVAQSLVNKLKTQVDKVVSENAGKFSSRSNLSLLVPCDASTRSVRNPCPEGHRGNMVDVVVPENVVSSHGEVTSLADIIQSSGHPQVEGSWENATEGILIHNPRAKEELHNFREIGLLPMAKLESTIPSALATEADMPRDEQTAVKFRSISQLNSAGEKKRKRGRRKAGGRWSRKSSV